MLEAASIAVVGASARPGSFGERLAREALRSPGALRVHLVHPRHRDVLGRACVPSLHEVPQPVDLVLLGVPDSALVDQLGLCARRGDAGAVVFGSAYGLGHDLADTARAAGMALCGAGCMGFVNVARGVRAIGYLERHPLQVGPVALVSHSGSAFSALLRTHRALAYSLAVSSGQELVTTAADYLHYALDLPETRVVALLLETLRDANGLRRALATAAARDVPVIALTVGRSPTGRAMVDAHSGALAGDDGAWEALFEAYGVHRVEGLDEMADTLELFAIGRRARREARGIATVHDSGAERAHVADVADMCGVAFAPLAKQTRSRLSGLLEPGLEPGNPLDVWGTGAGTRELFTSCLQALADDPAVGVVALTVDLVEEYDGDDSYVDAAVDASATTDVAVVVLSNVAAAVDQVRAKRLRAVGIPVLEGTRSGVRALGHLLAQTGARSQPAPVAVDAERRARWRQRLVAGPLDGVESLLFLTDYGLPAVQTAVVGDAVAAVTAAEGLGYPVVLKTDAAAQHHKSDVGGVRLRLDNAVAVEQTYTDLANRFGPAVIVQPQLSEGVELALGIVHDPVLGPLVVLAVGGTLVEVVAHRVVALPPLDAARAERMLTALPAARLLEGVRGRPPSSREPVVAALVALSRLAEELGDVLDAVDVNPLIATPTGATAVDALVLPRAGPHPSLRHHGAVVKGD